MAQKGHYRVWSREPVLGGISHHCPWNTLLQSSLMPKKVVQTLLLLLSLHIYSSSRECLFSLCDSQTAPQPWIRQLKYYLVHAPQCSFLETFLDFSSRDSILWLVICHSGLNNKQVLHYSYLGEASSNMVYNGKLMRKLPISNKASKWTKESHLKYLPVLRIKCFQHGKFF